MPNMSVSDLINMAGEVVRMFHFDVAIGAMVVAGVAFYLYRQFFKKGGE